MRFPFYALGRQTSPTFNSDSSVGRALRDERRGQWFESTLEYYTRFALW